MPIVFILVAATVTVCALMALRPPTSGATGRADLRFLLGFLVNEVPQVAIAGLALLAAAAAAAGALDGPVGFVALGLSALATAILLAVLVRGLGARSTLGRALAGTLNERSSGMPTRHPWATILLTPLPVRPRRVVRIADVSYGPAGPGHLLDVYHRESGADGPVLVYLHGGGFTGGDKHREGRPLVHRLAAQGWLCVSADYRLAPEVLFPGYLVDVKRAIGWVRHHAPELGGDPDRLFVAGSSAGGYLAAAAALTSNDPRYQPDDDPRLDTSVSGAVGLYGYYGAPRAWDGHDSDAGSLIDRAAARPAEPGYPPPFLVVHGDQDTVVPVQGARRFVERLRAASDQPVVYAELRGAQHGFDALRSARTEAVVDAVLAFSRAIDGAGSDRRSPPHRAVE